MLYGLYRCLYCFAYLVNTGWGVAAPGMMMGTSLPSRTRQGRECALMTLKTGGHLSWAWPYMSRASRALTRLALLTSICTPQKHWLHNVLSQKLFRSFTSRQACAMHACYDSTLPVLSNVSQHSGHTVCGVNAQITAVRRISHTCMPSSGCRASALRSFVLWVSSAYCSCP